MTVARHEFLERVVADSRDRPSWMAHRRGKIGGSDAGKMAKRASAPSYARALLAPSWGGNAATAHGHEREARMLAAFGLVQNHAMFRSVDNPRHVCTPDAIRVTADGTLVLAQAKTANKPLPDRIPPGYLRQMWWEQYVMGAARTLLVWEHHENYKPVSMEPVSVLIPRDDDAIAELILIADDTLERFDRALADRKTME